MRKSNSVMGLRRRRAGYETAVPAAKIAKCSRVYLLHIEEGFAVPSRALAVRLSKVYQRSADWVIREATKAREQRYGKS